MELLNELSLHDIVSTLVVAMLLLITTPISWKQAYNTVFSTDWKTVLTHSRTARKGKCKCWNIVSKSISKVSA